MSDPQEGEFLLRFCEDRQGEGRVGSGYRGRSRGSLSCGRRRSVTRRRLWIPKQESLKTISRRIEVGSWCPLSAIAQQWASFANHPFPLRSSNKADGVLIFVPRLMMRRPQVPMSFLRSKRQDGRVSSRQVPYARFPHAWAHLFAQSLASMTGDLSSMTAPPFILSPTSLTEFPAYWGERPELFADIAQGRTEQDRMERVLRWFICTLKGQYTVSRRGGVGGGYWS